MALNATNPPPRLKAALRGRTADFYTLTPVGAECRLFGYCEHPEWTIADAMALSGAAVAPQNGKTENTLKGRALAPIGVNLGKWVDHKSGKLFSSGWFQHIEALFGYNRSHDGTGFISDGGHVENLGVYALLRRRCAFILAIDGEEDPNMTFSGLMTLQHLARVEQGVTLDIDLSSLHLGDDNLSDTHFTVIPVTYPEIPGAAQSNGVIVYVKLSLTGDEPEYLRSFKKDNPAFPHHSTAFHQSFDDRTFEAYLALGEHVGAQLTSEEWVGQERPDKFEAWFEALVTRFLDR